jgi:hypothetical protein
MFRSRKKKCEVHFIEEHIIIINGEQYHHNSHILQEIKKIELSNGRKLDKIIAGGTGGGGTQPETEGYFSTFQIKDGDNIIFSTKGKFNFMALSMTDTQQASGVLTFKDKKLAITDVPDGAVQLTVADTNVATATYEDSTNTVTVVAGNPGVTALTIKATNKAGADIHFDDIAIEILGSDAVTGGVDFKDPTEQP